MTKAKYETDLLWIKRAKRYALTFNIFVGILIVLICSSPLIFSSLSFQSDSETVSNDHSQHISDIIDAPDHRGVRLSHDIDELDAFWAVLSSQWTDVKDASKKELARLAVSIYDGPIYDSFQVNKTTKKVNFFKDKKKVYTVNFTGY